MACTGCVLGKGYRQAIPQKADSRSTKLLELLHSDLNGPVEVVAISSLLLMTILDGRPYTP